jgi:RNA polymerase sigma-70 factor (ECF subfamily)
MSEVEERITAALARGDHGKAAEHAVRGYGKEILGYLSRILGSRDDAADAFSLFAEQLWKGMPRFAGRSSVRVWAYRVAWSAGVRVRDEAWRRRRHHLHTSMASAIAQEVISHTPGSETDATAEMERLRSALSPEEQSLLVLRVDRGLSWKEVAEVMATEGQGADERTLRKRFERLKEKLTKLAQERGIFD